MMHRDGEQLQCVSPRSAHTAVAAGGGAVMHTVLGAGPQRPKLKHRFQAPVPRLTSLGSWSGPIKRVLFLLKIHMTGKATHMRSGEYLGSLSA
eukprot:4275091-Prymnesium_polylepis.1